MPTTRKITTKFAAKPEVWAPSGDPEFEATWGKIESTLTSAGAPIGADYRELTAKALSKYSGKTYAASSANYQGPPDAPDYEDTNAPPEPDVLVIPARPTDPYWYDDPRDARTLDHYILARRALGDAMHGALLITGPAGVGKTMSVAKSVERLNAQGHDLTLFKMDCATVTDPGKWFGRREADATGTHFVPSDFWISVERGDVVLLDEIMRLHPHIHNPIMALLDGSEAVTISDLNETITRHAQTVFIATTNQGTQYGGVHRMDWSMRERISWTIEREFPPREEEVHIVTSQTGCDEDGASRLVDFARKTRDLYETGDLRSQMSTRVLVAAGWLVASGMNERAALEVTVIPMFDGDASGMVGAESDRQKVQVIAEGMFGKSRR